MGARVYDSFTKNPNLKKNKLFLGGRGLEQGIFHKEIKQFF